MSDERYDRSADMRLLELQREAMGVPRRVIDSISYTDPDLLGDTSNDEDDTYVQSGTILIAAIDARPRRALIPGAVVLVSLSVANDGDTAARDVRMSLPLPVATAYRPGSLELDGKPVSEDGAYEFFENGVALGDIEPGARSTLVVKLVVEAGSTEVILSPQLTAAAGAILGLRAMRLTREAPSLRGVVAERPFYESDNDEHLIEPLAPATPEPTIAVLLPRELPPPVKPAPAAMPVSTVKTKPTAPPARVVRESNAVADLPVIPRVPVVPSPVATVVPVASAPGAYVAPTAPAAPVVPAPPKPIAPVAVQTIMPKPVPPVASKPATAVSPPAVSPPPGIAATAKPVLAVPANPVAAAAPKPVVPKAVAPKPVVAKPIAPVPSAKAVTKRVSEPKPPAKPTAKPKAKTKGKAQLQVVARPKIEVVRSVDDRISFAAQGGPILAVRIDRRRLATLTALFSGASLGMVAHYLVLNALAARDALPGDGSDASIAAFVASQEQLLSSALIMKRLGKTPSSDTVGAALPAFPPALATHADRRAIDPPRPGEALLFRAFQPTEIAFVQRMLSNDSAAPFMRAAQLFIGLCANDAALADETERRRVAVALTAYAALATAEISRIFLRTKLSGTPEIFKATESSFDDAARTVLAALARSIA